MDRGEPFAIGPAELQFLSKLRRKSAASSVARRTDSFRNQLPFSRFIIPEPEPNRPTSPGVLKYNVHIKCIRPLAARFAAASWRLESDNPSSSWIVLQRAICRAMQIEGSTAKRCAEHFYKGQPRALDAVSVPKRGVSAPSIAESQAILAASLAGSNRAGPIKSASLQHETTEN